MEEYYKMKELTRQQQAVYVFSPHLRLLTVKKLKKLP